VDVVGQQAIAEHAQAAAAAPLGEQLTVGVAIGIVKKNGLAVVPPLRNVVRDTDRNHARDAWHGGFQGSIVAGGQSPGFRRRLCGDGLEFDFKTW
jgi:hypothetical protein